jgi:hypothetical protein
LECSEQYEEPGPEYAGLKSGPEKQGEVCCIFYPFHYWRQLKIIAV